MTPAGLVILLAGGSVGAAAGRLLRLPMWPLTGAVVGAAVIYNFVGGEAVPGWWAAVAQILVGTAVGAALGPGVLRQFRSVLAPGVLAVCMIIGLGLAAGLGIAALGRVDPATAVFGTVPGGVGEMVAAAIALDADAPVVAGMHLTRLLITLSMLPLLVRWARHLTRGTDGRDEPDDPESPGQEGDDG